VIAIGGSLGAIDAIRQLWAALPADLAAAVAIVIHVGGHGHNLLAEIFDKEAGIPVSTAVDGEPFRQGHAYVAPADRHLLVLNDIIKLGHGPRENMARPALDPLFRSIALSYGPRAIGVVLTGLLNDGAAGLADLKRCGGITLVQSPADAEAPDMPLGALRASDVDYRAPIAQLAKILIKLTSEEAGPAPVVPHDIKLEVEIAAGRNVNSRELLKIAEPVTLPCPTCGGVLSQIRREPLRFRCQVGHSFTAEALAGQTDNAVEEALRVALRITEERAVLTEKMAEDAHRSGRYAAARANEARARESRHYAEILQRAIEDEGGE
jgi:two-component system chemotaxis response regulator CheB